MILQNESGNKYYNITINKRSVFEGIDEELKNILQTCTSLDQQNFIKVKELKETSLGKINRIRTGRLEKSLRSTSKHRTFLYPCGY